MQVVQPGEKFQTECGKQSLVAHGIDARVSMATLEQIPHVILKVPCFDHWLARQDDPQSRKRDRRRAPGIRPSAPPSRLRGPACSGARFLGKER